MGNEDGAGVGASVGKKFPAVSKVKSVNLDEYSNSPKGLKITIEWVTFTY